MTTPDQAMLLEASTRFAETYDVRAFAGYDVTAAADLGWFAMFVPEEHGGGSVSGDPVADAVLLAQLHGAYLFPEPFVGTNTVAAVLADHPLLPDLASGKVSATVPVSGRLTATLSGGDYVLQGDVVVDDPAAAWLLFTAQVDDVPQLFFVAAPDDGTPLECLDLTRRLRRLNPNRVPADARVDADPEYAVTVATVLSVADSVGAMDRLFAMTRQYALDRIAFGRPIGSFQALKHLLADVSLVLESSKAVLAAATRALSGGEPYANEVASIAAVYVGERSARFAQDCLQVHGGIGFAWEHDLHLYLRRLTTNAALHGDVDFHRARILRAHARELAA